MVLAVAAMFLQVSVFSPAGPAVTSNVAAATPLVANAVAETPVVAKATVPASAPATPVAKADSPSTDAGRNLPNAPEPNDGGSRATVKNVSYDGGDASQNGQSFSTVRVPEINLPKDAEITSAERLPKRTWLMLAAVQHGAAAFDAYSTRYAVGHGAVEQDPLMKPFANSGSIYVVSQACPLVLDYVARKMQRSENGLVRKMWWMPQSVATATYLFAGVHNMHVANEP
ncbi:MAG TPA: hypothetical protein VMH00_14970 [Candidatus Limnocylindrales bacterium]|nr:hypothetical protein [Candidatus Limnocylindrales bacterium]